MNDPERTGANQPNASAADPDDAGPAEHPGRIGRFRVERVLGKGGFGIVYLAHDEQLQRLVAIKVSHRKLVDCPEAVEAYLTEARTVANLDHPHIVPVYDVGSTDEFPCYVISKYIDGTDLATRLKQSRLSINEVVELVATVAEALHHAHKQGLVHRDVKPGNILLDKSGKPFVADFGLALREQDVGKGPRYAGTPAYMSPEQARGEGHRVDGRSDIFSVGVVLYELLTSRRPFKGDSRDELLEQISSVEARPPRQFDDAIPKELERICLKALAKRTSDRYTTAKDIADDLRHFLASASVEEKAPVTSKPIDDGATGTPASSPTPASAPRPIMIVPKGLRSFDANDADFFLELLPDPRDRDGLPECIRFWKTRIETTDSDNSFSVGLIFGPSGCGKSSLVKAALLPRLARHVIAVYVAATAEDTEIRLLKGLRSNCPGLPENLGLIEILAALRRGQYAPVRLDETRSLWLAQQTTLRREQDLSAGAKLVLVLDQFEQWLHAKGGDANAELIQALRHCDGAHVQCVVMVRDDFGMAAIRFMGAVDIPILQGHNFATVDLFDLLHARKVLAEFGRAFGRLPDNLGRCTTEQEAFLDQAVSGLAQEGKVISVRLALFAEMVKGKPWAPATLKEVGGMAGVGVTFLEETFAASTAPPQHRLHQKAAQAVLKALLPDIGTDIKGNMRAQKELLLASGYVGQPKSFNDLLRILDGELRLITPTDPEGIDPKSAASTKDEGRQKYYQLTHDYLVHSLRDWLTRKQKETRKGRAELLLADRTHEWTARPEKRKLPGLTEWIAIRVLTSPRAWTIGQRQIMRAAGARHLVGVGRLLAIVVLVVSAGLYFREYLAQKHAVDTVSRLFDAKIAETPAIINELADQHRRIDPLLEKILADPAGRRDHQLHSRLALLPIDPRQVAPLRESLLQADADEFPTIRDALAPYRENLIAGFWEIVESAQDDPRRRFLAAAALATYDPSASRWKNSDRWVAEQLVAQSSLALPRWVDALRPVKDQLLPALMTIHREHGKLPTGSTAAAEVIGAYAADQPTILADALAYATPQSFAILFAHLQPHSSRAVSALTALLDQMPPAVGPEANKTAVKHVNLAIALLRLGAGERLGPLLKASANPRARSFAIDRFAVLGCRPNELLGRFDQEPTDSIRAALLLGLGGFDEQTLPASLRAALRSKLLSIYRQDASAEVHAAVYWLLGTWGMSATAATEDKAKGWYVNAAGQTMIRISGPVTFMMGTSLNEPGNSELEKLHEAQIDHAYDIGMTEVTVGQFKRFLEQRPDHFDRPEQVGAAARRPATKISWYLAAEYCNWLSKSAGLLPDQWCYEPNEQGQYADGMKISPGYQRKTGYRLPTETEWEYACRGGAATSRCYGNANELLPRYAWYAASEATESAPVAQLLPNAFGLFDMHGNAAEWCQNALRSYDDQANLDLDDEIVRDSSFRAVRGGSIFNTAQKIRSATRFSDRPATADTCGFRVARSRP